MHRSRKLVILGLLFSWFFAFNALAIYAASPPAKIFTGGRYEDSVDFLTEVYSYYPLPYERLYFKGYDSTNGHELWISNGTTTRLVKDIYPGSTSSFLGWFTNIGGKLYFRAQDNVSGTELWVSDGTTAGTTKVKDIRAGSASSSPYQLTNVGGMLYFIAQGGSQGPELWKYNPSVATSSTNPVHVKTLYTPAPTSTAPCWGYGYEKHKWAGLGGKLYFAWCDDTHGEELWVSDGTASGTYAIDHVAGTGGASVDNITAVGNMLYFTTKYGSNGLQLWKYDPATATSTVVKNLYDATGSGDVCYGAWEYAGDYPKHFPHTFKSIKNKLYFTGCDAADGAELWVSDGTELGTKVVNLPHKWYGVGSSNPSFLDYDAATDSIYFAAQIGADHEIEVWQVKFSSSDPNTLEGSSQRRQFDDGTDPRPIPPKPQQLTAVNGYLFFTSKAGLSSNKELWADPLP